jgi:hypothetical protein
MKPYNGGKRSMLQIGKRTTSLFQALKKQNLASLITDTSKLTKHKVSLKFNATGGDDDDRDGNWGLGTNRRPQAFDENYMKFKGHIFGP